MSVKDERFPASSAFDFINEALKNETDRTEAVKNAKAVYCFTLKNQAGDEQSWFLDLKKDGVVGKGTAPAGQKANVTLLLSETDFGKLVEGKANAQKLFMSGKLKVKGDVMKATKMEGVLKKAQQVQAKL